MFFPDRQLIACTLNLPQDIQYNLRPLKFDDGHR